MAGDQLPIPGIPEADARLQELSRLQREALDAWERYDEARIVHFCETALPSLLRRQAE